LWFKSLAAIRKYGKQVGVSTNGVLNKLNALCFAVLVQFYTDEVYAPQRTGEEF